MGHMFEVCVSLQLLNLANFNTSNATNMANMFSGCTSLQAVNLESFDTSKVTNMYCMFRLCKNLVTIYVSTNFIVDLVQDSNYMFMDCTNLVGGAGTTYAVANPQDKTYARIDGGITDPGYFTLKRYWVKCTPYLKENGVWVPMKVYM